MSRRSFTTAFVAGMLAASSVIAAPVATGGTAAAAGGIGITEVAPWASSNSPYAADWFELTNSTASTLNVSGWKMDDSSSSFATSVALNGISTIAPGESVIFLETAAPATVTTFLSFWFGVTPPAGLQVGTYTGSGVGLSTSGDGVSVFDGAGTLQASVTFGVADATNPFSTFDNAAGADGAISAQSAVGVHAAFAAGTAPTDAIGSPGSVATPGLIRVTEIAPWSSGNSSLAADWFELTNVGGTAVNVSGWKVDDNSNSFAAALALNGVTTIGPGESVIFIESASSAIATTFKTLWFGASPPAGLQVGTYSGSGIGLSTSGDAVNIYDASGTSKANVVFGTSGTTSPFATFDNTVAANGATVSTLSAVGVNLAFSVVDTVGAPPNVTTPTLVASPGTNTLAGGGGGPTTSAAPTTTQPALPAWPGGPSITAVDEVGLAPENLSGLEYEDSGSAAPDSIWAVLNSPSQLFQLQFNGTAWVPATTKTLLYPNGLGIPDAEGVTVVDGHASNGLFVGTERDTSGANSSTSKNAILRFDPSVAGASISATGQWDLTADLPATGANLGIETVTWLPDLFLTGQNLLDEHTNLPYNPSSYPNHGTGLFAVGVEANGMFYVYALDLTGSTFTRVATFTSGLAGVMASDFDPDTGLFWAHCDNGCANRTSLLRISPSTHKFEVSATYAAAGDMPIGENFEGMTIAPNDECVDNLKPVYWSDDGDGVNFPTVGHSLVVGRITCSATPPVEVPEFPTSVLASLMGIAVLGGTMVLARRRRPATI